MVQLAGTIMIKNEEKRLLATLNSIKSYVDCLIILDTGSEDKTLDILKNFTKENNILLHLKLGKFVDFATSRNELLDFADTIGNVDYLLLLDSNDELRNGDKLKTFVQTAVDDAYYLTHIWKNETEQHYFKNINLIKPRTNWRYVGVVHEYLCHNDSSRKANDLNLEPQIFQDRVPDMEKSKLRYTRDKELLLKEYQDNKTPRTVFYLARTCRVLHQYQDAYKYFKERAQIKISYWEERYHSMYSCGELANDWGTKRKWFMDAWELGHRAEPLLRMAEHYRKEKDVLSMFMMARMACDLKYPSDHKLFVNKEDYDYVRWHLLGIAGFYCGKFADGKEGSYKAVCARDLDVDKQALDIYLKREALENAKYSKSDYIELRVCGNGVSREQADKEWEEFRF